MIKEINFFGVYFAPFAGYLAVALLVFIPVRIWFDRIEIQKWVWHRWLFEIAVYLSIVSVIGLIFEVACHWIRANVITSGAPPSW